MPDIVERFSPAAVAATRAAIAEAGGNEVFLLGTLCEGRVGEVRVLARGNRHAVPAVIRALHPGDVVIHNHPSGTLVPSDADLEIAAAIATDGVGSYLVDNAVNTVYVIVEPHVAPASTPIDLDAATSILGPHGRIAQALPGYEHRVQQLAMAGAVSHAFNDGSILTVEAGTGIGKSLAYLVPAILWSTTNGQRVLISTHTINLQEQLVAKDLPLLTERAGLPCRVALVKGRANYVCRRKAAQVAAEPELLIEDDVSRELRDLLEWARSTRDGSLADLPVRPRPAVWEQIMSESDNCLRARCPFFASCCFYNARRTAAAADLVVVNHHLLMADLALRAQAGDGLLSAVLPAAAHVIIDEAHHLEDVATLYFGGRASLGGIERALTRLQSSRHERKGVLPALLAALAGPVPADVQPLASGARDRIESQLLPRRRSLGATAEECFGELVTAYVVESSHAATSGTEKTRITPQIRSTEFWASATRRLERLATALRAFAADCEGVVERLEQLVEFADRQVLYLSTELGAQAARLAAVADALFAFTENPSEDPADVDATCRWMELHRRTTGPALSLHSAPIEVAPLLRRTLFERFHTTVLTSATLAVNGRFDYLHDRCGLREAAVAERTATLRIRSPFDFPSQALLCLPGDLPDPGHPAYEDAAQSAMRDVLAITDGGTFLLFTAYGALNRAYAALASDLAAAGLTPLKQGDANRHTLLARFVADPRAVLFATDSFWEGVDVRGDALRCVVIARLPFKVPTEPIEQARVEAIQARGGNPFLDHTVPQAVLKLTQGFGRLIRSRTDRGCVVVLDSRILTKRYGDAFLASLPPARRAAGSLKTVLDAMRQFFADPPASAIDRPPTRCP